MSMFIHGNILNIFNNNNNIVIINILFFIHRHTLKVLKVTSICRLGSIPLFPFPVGFNSVLPAHPRILPERSSLIRGDCNHY